MKTSLWPWCLTCVLVPLLVAGCGSPTASNGSASDSRKEPAAAKHSPEELGKSQEKLRKIGAAYVKLFPSCPAGFTDRDKKPILSWRVALLPHLGHDDLFKRFNLQEPWDGPNNSKLIAEIPEVYRPVKGEVKVGHTYYQGFVGPEAMFQSRGTHGPTVPEGAGPIPMFCKNGSHIIDGTSYTFFVVEGGEAVPWTRPDDLFYDAQKPLPKLGGQFGGDFNACFCDGSVHLIPRTAPEKLVRALITPAGQERVDLREIGLPDPRFGLPPGTGAPAGECIVSGRVSYKGLALPAGTVTFHQANGKKYVAAIGADGGFSLRGLAVGDATVSVETQSVKDAPSKPAVRVRIPEKYRLPATSGLIFGITGGKQTIDISLND